MANANERNIKNYSHFLCVFIVVNWLIYMFRNNLNLELMNETYSVLTDGIVATVSSLITFILNGLLPSNFKAVLVFWRTKDTYPGCRIFTKLIDKDCRIDKSVLMRTHGNLPTGPQEQNKLWYKIFKRNEFDPMIFESHRSFLLSRDLTGLSFIFLIIYSVAALRSRFAFGLEFQRLWQYIIFLLAQYIILSIVSRIYGNRFACNVLAKDSSNVNIQV